uniref:Putative transporter n=1 Tax=Ornithodoros turicata TaxID=34597 RepID=A0A2R5L782_9ACAR
MTIKENLVRMSKYATPNMELVPLKAHMFLLFGAAVGVMPFTSLIAKQLGISAGHIGIINTTLLFLSIAIKFVIGSITDKLQKLKLVIIVVIIFESIFHILIITLPPIGGNDVTENVSISGCDMHNRTFSICLDEASPASCDVQEYHQCTLSCSGDLSDSGSWDTEVHSNVLCEKNKCALERFLPNSSFENVCVIPNPACSVTCTPVTKPNPIFRAQFWLFALFRIISGMGFGVAISLADTATYSILKANKEDYGKQRLWGTIGWGAMAPVVGLLNDLLTNGSSHVDYSPGFYILGAFAVLDILVLFFFLDIPATSPSDQLLKDVSSVLAKPRAIFFIFSVFNMGCLMGLIWSYALWYLQDLGASSTLLGLNLAVQCFGGEVPVLFFSGWIIRKIGYGKAVSLSIAGVVLRFGVYSFGTNPWAMLPVEITHGLCFGLVYAALTTYASVSAPPGTEATMQGILSGTFEGLGVGTGTLVCGQLFNLVGGRQTMYIFFIYSVVCLLVHVCADFFLSRTATKEAVRARTVMVDGSDAAIALQSDSERLSSTEKSSAANGSHFLTYDNSAALKHNGTTNYVIA